MILKTSYKYFVPILTVILALLTAMSPFAIDTYLPAMPEMATVFKVGINKIHISVTIYFLGFALGNFIGGPFSDSFGRKPIAITGIILYGVSAFLITKTSSIEQVWILRLTQALGGGFASVTSLVFVKDWFHGKKVASMATIIGMIMMLAPLFAPIIGTIILQKFHWQGIFYFLSFFSLFLLILIAFVIPESRDNNLITRHLNFKQFFEKYTPFFKSQKAVLMLLTLSFSAGGMFVFIPSAAYLYLDYYGFSIKIFPLLFGANVALNIVFSFSNTLFLKKYEPETLLQLGITIQLLAGLLIATSALLVDKPSFYLIFIGIIVFIGALGLVFGNGNAIILNLLPQISGSANATIGLTRFVVSFIVGSIPAFFPNSGIVAIGLTMFASVAIGFAFAYWFNKIK